MLKFSSARRLERIHIWSSRYHVSVPQINLHCQGVENHNGTLWLMAGSVVEQLAPVFELGCSESEELDAQPCASDDLHLAPGDQHLRPGTQLLQGILKFSC